MSTTIAVAPFRLEVRAKDAAADSAWTAGEFAWTHRQAARYQKIWADAGYACRVMENKAAGEPAKEIDVSEKSAQPAAATAAPKPKAPSYGPFEKGDLLQDKYTPAQVRVLSVHKKFFEYEPIGGGGKPERCPWVSADECYEKISGSPQGGETIAAPTDSGEAISGAPLAPANPLGAPVTSPGAESAPASQPAAVTPPAAPTAPASQPAPAPATPREKKSRPARAKIPAHSPKPKAPTPAPAPKPAPSVKPQKKAPAAKSTAHKPTKSRR